MATRSDLGSSLGNLVRKAGCGRLTKQEAIDIAQTISTIVSSCQPFKGLALKAIYGGRDQQRDEILAIALGSILKRSIDGRRKESEQMRLLGMVTIKALRANELYGDTFPMKRMAYDIGISRECFTRNEKWRALRYMALEQLMFWLESGTNEVGSELCSRGWM